MRGGSYFQGWYEEGRAKMYVSSGVGSVHFPMRFRCPPEITVFNLRYDDGETEHEHYAGCGCE
jgi:predicted MPP superfamily phosphohydrolase